MCKIQTILKKNVDATRCKTFLLNSLLGLSWMDSLRWGEWIQGMRTLAYTMQRWRVHLRPTVWWRNVCRGIQGGRSSLPARQQDGIHPTHRNNQSFFHVGWSYMQNVWRILVWIWFPNGDPDKTFKTEKNKKKGGGISNAELSSKFTSPLVYVVTCCYLDTIVLRDNQTNFCPRHWPFKRTSGIDCGFQGSWLWPIKAQTATTPSSSSLWRCWEGFIVNPKKNITPRVLYLVAGNGPQGGGVIFGRSKWPPRGGVIFGGCYIWGDYFF